MIPCPGAAPQKTARCHQRPMPRLRRSGSPSGRKESTLSCGAALTVKDRRTEALGPVATFSVLDGSVDITRPPVIESFRERHVFLRSPLAVKHTEFEIVVRDRLGKPVELLQLLGVQAERKRNPDFSAVSFGFLKRRDEADIGGEPNTTGSSCPLLKGGWAVGRTSAVTQNRPMRSSAPWEASAKPRESCILPAILSERRKSYTICSSKQKRRTILCCLL